MGEGRHVQVHVGGFPEGAAFALETERRERAVVSAGAGDAEGVVVGVGQQVGRHEGAVRVAAHAYAPAIDDAQGI